MLRIDYDLLDIGDVALSFKDASLDVAVCCEVLENLTDDRQGIKEMGRVPEEGGATAVNLPTYISQAICWKLSPDYHVSKGRNVTEC